MPETGSLAWWARPRGREGRVRWQGSQGTPEGWERTSQLAAEEALEALPPTREKAGVCAAGGATWQGAPGDPWELGSVRGQAAPEAGCSEPRQSWAVPGLPAADPTPCSALRLHAAICGHAACGGRAGATGCPCLPLRPPHPAPGSLGSRRRTPPGPHERHLQHGTAVTRPRAAGPASSPRPVPIKTGGRGES